MRVEPEVVPETSLALTLQPLGTPGQLHCATRPTAKMGPSRHEIPPSTMEQTISGRQAQAPS